MPSFLFSPDITTFVKIRGNESKLLGYKKKNADSMTQAVDILNLGYPHLSSEKIGLMHNPRKHSGNGDS